MFDSFFDFFNNKFCLSGLRIARIIYAVIIAAFMTAAGVFGMSASAAAVTEVRYETLRELVAENNSSVKNSSYFDTVEELEQQLAVLRQECEDMVAMAKIYSDSEEASEYRSSASNFNSAIKQLEKQLDRQTGSNASINDTIESITFSAKTVMVNYLLMERAAEAALKQYEVSELKYSAAQNKYSAGMFTEADVSEAHAAMLDAETDYQNYKQQSSSLRRDLFDLLGLNDDGSVVIIEPSEPDASSVNAFIEAIDFSADLDQAVNNDAAVQSARHTASSSTADMELKEVSEKEAVGNASADYNETLTLLHTRYEEYTGAVSAMAAAENTYQSMLRKRNAGMLTDADFLSAEADYILAEKEHLSACMNLTLACDSYLLMLEGIV